MIQFIEQQRKLRKITKRELCASADISTQYYDLLIHGKSVENRRVTELLLKKVGFKLSVVPEDF
jgi:transcriptional regulator with XRE-family HTH domain